MSDSPNRDKAADKEPSKKAKSEPPTDSPFPAAPEFDFEEISQGGDRVYIKFGNARYELKRTRSGRLVLHK